MTVHPWISVKYTAQVPTLWIHNSSFSELCRGEADLCPSVVTFVGSKKKSVVLGHVMGHAKAIEPHGQIRLMTPRLNSSFGPEIYMDCEIGHSDSLAFEPRLTTCVARPIHWLQSDTKVAQNLSEILISSVLAPLSHVLCYFAADLHGIPGIANILAIQAIRNKAHTLPLSALPHVLIVVDTRSTRFKASTVEQKLNEQIVQIMGNLKEYTDLQVASSDLKSVFRSIQVLGLRKDLSSYKHSELLQQRLTTLNGEVHWRRTATRHLFRISHIKALSERVLTRFCDDNSIFNFLRESRPDQFSCRETMSHLEEALNLMPNPSWLWGVIIPMVASAIFLANYPPGSHQFYESHCREVIRKYTADVDIRRRFVVNIKEELKEMFALFEADPREKSAARQHIERLKSMGPHLADMKSLRSCLSCFALMPDKVLECGHAICNVCVRRFGQHSPFERHTFRIPACILCGRLQPKEKSTFRLTPPSAGIRILCIDGGGVRGVIPLIFLHHLNNELGYLRCPLHEFFDYVGGTSAGGLIAIGVFLKRWTPRECLTRFEAVAKITFRTERENRLSLTQRIQRMLKAWVQDHRYNLSPIEKAFGSEFEGDVKMFNPLQSDTKVAVTATTVRDNRPCIFSNYNGQQQSTTHYQHVRPESYSHEITISDAAACTSAAPFFFKSKDVNFLDTYQDGGLRHNNPAFIASWECARLWPERCQMFDLDGRIDHMVSLGTGALSSAKYQVGPHSPRMDRFLPRLASNLKHQLDAEQQWMWFYNCIPLELRHRYHRLNAYYPGSEPALNDVAAIDQLKRQAKDSLVANPHLALAKDYMLASIFYFEIEEVSRLEGGGYHCAGHVFCRLPLDIVGRKALYESLEENRASFVVNKRSKPCVNFMPEGIPPYRCLVELVTKGMEDKIQISFRSVTTQASLISGMPATLSNLVRAQGLDAPFGRVDKVEDERPLPIVPSKRGHHEI
ncbi:FabD/lysophospholipase-like protein [Lentithecium fluviatile CBS 122367]|uniref:FabD/lysophospholipase-like protein n=1 Tax=Lentithecium fluviatile CBS 122367 TaxID=1168545 RepID=A0A6G1IRD1_9PLEO|nr:FabD/lysophospholipase-like protein [Lentithecium fluviatile CBS 122367]